MANIFVDDEHLGTGDQPTSGHEVERTDDEYLKLAADAYDGSSTYWEANFYKTWQRNLSNFRSKHPSGSKYHTDAYAKRSRLFRPKSRAAVRRAEAAVNMAFFSTQDAVSVDAEDEANPMNLLAAEIRKELLNYRLSHPNEKVGLPWFMTVLGAYQDCKVMGSVCSYQDWLYEERTSTRRVPAVDETGNPVLDGETGEQWVDEITERKVIRDRPDSRLVPLENVRFHPAASWIDPVNSSPYFIEILPMYVYEVREKMAAGDWHQYANVDFARARRDTYDTVRQERDGRERRDPHEDGNGGRFDEFSTVWVHRNIIRHRGQDLVFHTLGTMLRLDDPRPIEEVWEHGMRPYVIGTCMVETHRVMPSAPIELSQDLQSAANEIQNSRFDNVRLALNKRYFYNRNGNVDLRALRASSPGAAVGMDNLNDVQSEEFNDVTASSYQEQDRLNLDFDDISGTFSPGSIQSNRAMNETVGGLNLLSQDSNVMSEHELKVFSNTWVEKVLNQIDALIMHNESDATVLKVAGSKSKMWRQIRDAYIQQSGIEPQVDPEQLASETVAVRVDVGFGATNPQGRIEKLMMGMNVIGSAAPGAMARIKEDSLIDEVFGILGWQSGARFFEQEDDEQDPRLAQMQQQLQALQQEIETEMHKAKAKAEGDLALAQAKAVSEMDRARLENDARVRIAEINATANRYRDDMGLVATRAGIMIDRGKLALDRDRFKIDTEEKTMDRLASDTEMARSAEQERGANELRARVQADSETHEATAGELRQAIAAMESAVTNLSNSGVQQAESLASRLDRIADDLAGLNETVERREESEEQLAEQRAMIRSWLLKNGTDEVKGIVERTAPEGQA